jgi:NADPH-dependent 2,4-dienoyl-CoA reductase/sulfur reductase-like enzyme
MKYVIIGNGVAGTTAAFTVRGRDSNAQITVVSGESDYFFSRTALMYAFMDRMSLRDLEPHERKVYDRQAIHRIRGQVVDLDASAHTVTLASGQSMSYDRLLLAAGSVPRRPDWPGLDRAREGVCNFVTLQDLAQCEDLTRSSREVVIVGGGLIGIELAECVVHHGCKLTFLVREPWYWPAALGAGEGAMISDHIRRHGVDLLHDEQVAEVLSGTNGRVGGVRTESGKEFPCQMLGIAIGVRPSIDWLARVATPPDLGAGILVRSDFSTSLPDVFAAGDCAELPTGSVEQLWYSAKRQGEFAGRSMLGDAVDYHPPVFYNSAKFFEIEYTTVGSVNDAPPDAVHFYHRIPGKEASVRIVERGGAVIGFNMLGSRWNNVVLERWILERRELQYVLRSLHEAQFDVEFGRLDLRSLTAAGGR